MMRKQFNNQKGTTMWGWLSLFIMVGFLAMLAFKVIPIYYEHSVVKSIAQELVESREFENMSNRQIMSAIGNRLTINNVREINKENFKPARDRTGEKFIRIEYARKVNIMGTLSAIAEFNEEIRETR